MQNPLLISLLLILFTSCSPMFRALNISPSEKVGKIHFDTTQINPVLEFWYSEAQSNAYLTMLRKSYSISSLVKDDESELEKVKTILDWTSKQWQHNGNNKPEKGDAISILEEARNGKNFRCVEYGIVATAAINSVGIPARVLGLKSKDVEKVKYGAGHVVGEVYLQEFNKWIFIDPQWNILVSKNGIPLNGIELQQAIVSKDNSIEFMNKNGLLSENEKSRYVKWIGKYLFYFNISFDNRYDIDEKQRIAEKRQLMLVPVGADKPEVFQRDYPIDYCIYTHSLKDFYKKPQ